jgi:hypothetical protein
MERFLGLTQEEIEKNQSMWFEEREAPEDSETSGSDLRSIGISPGDLETDTETADSLDDMGNEELGPDGMPPAVAGPEAMPAGAAGAPAGMPNM